MYSEITEFLPANSASPTIIARGIYRGTPAYFKIFYNGTDPQKRHNNIEALLYESSIYKFISHQDENIKNFFVQFLHSTDTTLDELIQTRVIKERDNKVLVQRMQILRIDYTSKIHLIVTENSDSESLSDYLKRQTNTYNNNNYNLVKKKLSNIFDLVIQGIYILNNKLKIQHNDMHFMNILIKKEDKEYKLLDSDKYLESDYKISIYDFDRAYRVGYDNQLLKELCEFGAGCNNLSYKDMFVFIQSIIFQYLSIESKPEYSLLTRYFNDLINALIPNAFKDPLITNMKNIFNQKSDLHWSSYCLRRDNAKLLYFSKPCDTTAQIDTYLPWLANIYVNFSKFVKDLKNESYNYNIKKNNVSSKLQQQLHNSVINSFSTHISNKIPGLDIEDIVQKKYPNPLAYIKHQTDENMKLTYRNHPRIREIDNLVLYDKSLYDLEYGDYNYAIFKDTFTDKFHIAFGRVTEKIELGVKHSMIVRGFPVYLSGELQKRKDKDKDKDKFTYNYNSSNFNTVRIRMEAYNKLVANGDPNKYIKKYYLDVSDVSKQDQVYKQTYELALLQFYIDFIKPFTEEIFSHISGYPDRKYKLNFNGSAIDLYMVRNNTTYLQGLHTFYTQPDNFSVRSQELTKQINNKGQKQSISKMCVLKKPNGDCEGDNYDNVIDVLDDLFIQLLYQRENIKNPEKLQTWYYDDDFNIKNNLLIAIYESGLYFFPEIEAQKYNLVKLVPEEKNILVNKYLNLWLVRYLQKNYDDNFISKFIYNPLEQLQSPIELKTISEENKKILEILLKLLKIILYSYMRIVINIELNDCHIYEYPDQIFKLNINYDKEYNMHFKTNLLFYIPTEKIYYDATNTYFNPTSYPAIFDSCQKDTSKYNDIKARHSFTSINLEKYYSKDFKKNIKPIDYISFKNKYLKYKQKYFNLKSNNI
jgi:hypothetical protein